MFALNCPPRLELQHLRIVPRSALSIAARYPATAAGPAYSPADPTAGRLGRLQAIMSVAAASSCAIYTTGHSSDRWRVCSWPVWRCRLLLYTRQSSRSVAASGIHSVAGPAAAAAQPPPPSAAAMQLPPSANIRGSGRRLQAAASTWAAAGAGSTSSSNGSIVIGSSVIGDWSKTPVRARAAALVVWAAANGDANAAAAVEPKPELYLGPAGDLVSAIEILSYTRTFTQMCMFLENNSHLFRGPEVAALVLQAARVSELAAQRQVAAAQAVAERRAAELEAAGDLSGALSAAVLEGAVDEVLSAAGPGGGRDGADGDGDGGGGGTILDELDAADQLLGWATPLLRPHIKRYPPDAVSALLAALAQLQQYDRRLMELAAEVFKSDPRDWLRRAAATAEDDDDDADGDGGGSSDPWVTLVSLAGAFARLGHYDRELMNAIAVQAVELLPQVSQRAEADDAAFLAGHEEGGGFGGVRVTDSVVALLCSFLELNHLDPPLMQAVGEHLAAFCHQLDAGAVAEALQAYATFNARNPAFYSLLLRRLLESVGEAGSGVAGATAGAEAWVEAERGVEEGLAPLLTPRAAGLLYRACVLISVMGGVPELSPPAAVAGGAGGGSSTSTAAAIAAAKRGEVEASGGEADAEEVRRVGRALSALLQRCLAAYPRSALHVAPLGRPGPEQLEQAGAVPELLEAWEGTGLLTVPQILSTLELVPEAEPLPPAELTAAAAAAGAAAASEYGDGRIDDDAGLVVGGADAGGWVPPDALLLYGNTGSGSGSGVRIAVKALDEQLHCCRNVGLDPDSDLDQPGPRSGGPAATSSAAARRPAASRTGGSGGEVACGSRRRGRLLRLRGPALSELRCLEAWGWRVLVVPVGIWGEMDPAGRRAWLVRQLDELAVADDPVEYASITQRGGSISRWPEFWV